MLRSLAPRLVAAVCSSLSTRVGVSSSRAAFKAPSTSFLPTLSAAAAASSPAHRLFSSAPNYDQREFVGELNVIRSDGANLPCYRVLSPQGEVLDAAHDPELGEETLVKMYETMILMNTLDNVCYDVQRQGRISFYMTNYGESASHLGSAAVLKKDDVIYGQYRELGVLLWRGYTLENIMNQLYSNHLDLGKGRQMPVHYGSRELNFHTISSPLATQIPQASGAGYALRHVHGNTDACCVCYFGDGAASEGDFHAALNFAATLDSPTIFFCRNNGYAISTPVHEQYRGDGIAARGPGYGIDTIRVDGNDLFAVYNVMAKARKIATEESRPVLVEAMSYRVGHHSTSDDSTRYRGADEIEYWKKNDAPETRLRGYLEARGWWSQEREDEELKATRKRVLSALKDAEGRKKPGIDQIFHDTYAEVPPHLERQQAQLTEHLNTQGIHYPLTDFHK
eukprot:TRINITY_DN2123_c0_g1_i1.p1 TRINITY_DN2123_c0_g1~~TRINITY_DN2123_c0_g1_i1.p1  ORF type:complete len:506 (+),score=138.19 TRINITY_DN2123_c0_g1_i1:165-1520(+)